MSEEERISREKLLKRAAAIAGAVYVAPVLTSSASAGGKCAGKCHNDRRCQRRGGKNCFCQNGTCAPRDGCEEPQCRCDRQQPDPCGYLEPCGGDPNCGCFLGGNGQDPGHCIDQSATGGSCQGFQDLYGTCPGGCDSECAAGLVCFSSCCEEFGFPHLCAPCCGEASGPAVKSVSGPRTAWS